MQWPKYAPRFGVFTLLFAFVITSVGQSAAFRVCSNILQQEGSFFIWLFLSIAAVPFYGFFLLLAKRKGGFLPEVQGPQLRNSFFFLGFLTTINHWLESIAYDHTSFVMQATLSYSIIPYAVLIILSSNFALIRIFSTKALLGCGLIILGLLLHVGSVYIIQNDPALSAPLWWNLIFLFAQFPLALSAVYQQQIFTIRRLNALYMLFYTNLSQILFSFIFLPVNVAVDISFRDLDTVYQQFVNAYNCLLSSPTSPTFCKYSFQSILILYVCTMGSQLLQLMLIRRISYSFCAISMLFTPALVTLLGFIVQMLNLSKILFPSLLLDGLTSSAPFLELLLSFAALSGMIVYRLGNPTMLKLAYIFQADPVGVSGGKLTLLDFYRLASGRLGDDSLPSLLEEEKPSPLPLVDTPVQREEILETDEKGSKEGEKHPTHASSSSSLNLHRLPHLPHLTPLPSHILLETSLPSPTLPPPPSALKAPTEDVLSSPTKFVFSSSPPASDMPYPPAPLSSITPSTSHVYRRGENRRFLQRFVNHLGHVPSFSYRLQFPFGSPSPIFPVMLPVVLNRWSGNILCEYSDYKRNFNVTTHPPLRDAWYFSDEKLMAKLYLPSGYIWDQYTLQHVESLENMDKNIQQLYEYHRMGTLATALIEPERESSAEASSSEASVSGR